MEILFVVLVGKITSSFLLAMTIIDAIICQKDCNKGRDCCFKRTTGSAFQKRKYLSVRLFICDLNISEN